MLYRPCCPLNEEMSCPQDHVTQACDGVIPGLICEIDDPRLKPLANCVRFWPVALIRTIMYRRPSMIRAPWAIVFEHLSSLGTAVSPIRPAIPISIIRRGVCRRFTFQTAQTGTINIEFHEFRCRAGRDAYAGDVAFSPKPPTAFIYETVGPAGWPVCGCHGRSIYHRATENGEGQFRLSERLPAIVSFEDSFICEAAYPSITPAHRDASECRCQSGENCCSKCSPANRRAATVESPRNRWSGQHGQTL